MASINDLPDTVEALRPVTITGTATDNDGNPLTTDGRVAAVEVSVDGGTTWKVANSTDNWATWSYLLVSRRQQGAPTIKARAIDDSLNVYNITPDSEAVTVTAPSTFSAFSGATPGSPVLNNDATTIELGMRFAVDRAGSVTELKYWRGSGDANDTDVREGHLWRADGTLLATVTFTSGLGQTGWQVATLSSPVTLTAGTQYIVSYRTNDNYVSTNNFFVDANDVAFDGLDNNSFWGHGGVVRVVQDGVGGTNGVFHYGSGTPVMPSRVVQRRQLLGRHHLRRRQRAVELGPGHHLGRGADLAGEPAGRRHDHRDRRRRRPAHLRHRRRRRRRALHHQRPDRRCCASSPRRTTRPRPTPAPTTSTT